MATRYKTVVLSDLDSTVAHTRHRWHLTPQESNNYNWADYSAACDGDEPLVGTITALQLHAQHHQLHICSGRGAEAALQTERWLAMNGLFYDALVMRGIGDDRANAQIKIDYVNHLKEIGLRPVLFYEDHPSVAREIWKATGVPVVGINPFYEEDDHKAERVEGLKADAAGGGL